MRMRTMSLYVLIFMLLMSIGWAGAAGREVGIFYCFQDGQTVTLIENGNMTLTATCDANTEIAVTIDANSPIATAEDGILMTGDLPYSFRSWNDDGDCDYDYGINAISFDGEGINTHGGYSGLTGCLDVRPNCDCIVTGAMTIFNVRFP